VSVNILKSPAEEISPKSQKSWTGGLKHGARRPGRRGEMSPPKSAKALEDGFVTVLARFDQKLARLDMQPS
jgi:hypothetical protein